MNFHHQDHQDHKVGVLNRLLIVYLFLGIWIVGLVIRLIGLQIFESENYRILAERQQIGFIELSPRRGDILDRHLEELAISIQTDSVFAHPKEVANPFQAAQALAKILEQDRQELYKKLISERPFVYLARKISPRQSGELRKLAAHGIYFQKETKRVYPSRELAAHVLGFVGLDNEGLSGLEYLFNDLIKGRRTRVNLRLDALRQSYEREQDTSQNAGNVMVLNLDKTIQYIVEQVLQQTVRSTRAINGSAIVMNPHSGEILAMASYPVFDPNRYQDYHEEIRRNRAILEIYEPGSTFKIVPAAAVLNEDAAEPMETIDCRVGTLRIAGKVYREAKHSYGLLTFNQIVAKSSNVGTIKLALRLGEGKLYRYITSFGFGAQTGIELPGEQSGLLRPPPEWSKLSIGALAIGQELGVTPLQMLRAFAVIANGGDLVKPQLVRQVLTVQGDPVFRSKTEKIRILSQEAAQLAKDALSGVVEEGTGRSAQLNGYSSAGKTGTAQKFIDGRYSHTKYIASYAGFAPVERPALAAIVVINEPEGEYYGALVAAPAFKQIMERCLIHLKAPQDRPQYMELAAAKNISISEEEFELERFPQEKLEAALETLIQQKPVVQESDHTLTLEVGAFSLPDFSGQNLREAGRLGARLGLRLKASGSGVAVGQRPAPGTQVFRDTVCEVFFSTYATKQVALKSEVRSKDP